MDNRKRKPAKKICKRCQKDFETLQNRRDYCLACIIFKDKERYQNPTYRAKIAKKARERRAKNPKKFRELDRKKRIRYQERRRQNNLVFYALEKGRLTKPNYCSFCYIDCLPEGHHPDYAKPLEVVWLCKECHKKIHRLGLHRDLNALDRPLLDEGKVLKTIREAFKIFKAGKGKFNSYEYTVAHLICQRFGRPNCKACTLKTDNEGLKDLLLTRDEYIKSLKRC